LRLKEEGENDRDKRKVKKTFFPRFFAGEEMVGKGAAL
jgi:hypothetical protein